MLGITSLMIVFGLAGYISFGREETLAPITLNLAGTVYATLVKVALCIALYFTFPIMMFPVHDVLEDALGHVLRYTSSTSTPPSKMAKGCLRATVVCVSAWIAYSIPDFGKFLSLVGSSVCTLLGFILPCWFHLQTFHGNEVEVLVHHHLAVSGECRVVMIYEGSCKIETSDDFAIIYCVRERKCGRK